MNKIYVDEDGNLTADLADGSSKKYYQLTRHINYTLLFTDGTLVGFDLRSGDLTVLKKGPCYISHDSKNLFYGSTHKQFAIVEHLDTL